MSAAGERRSHKFFLRPDNSTATPASGTQTRVFSANCPGRRKRAVRELTVSDSRGADAASDTVTLEAGEAPGRQPSTAPPPAQTGHTQSRGSGVGVLRRALGPHGGPWEMAGVGASHVAEVAHLERL